MDIKSNFDKKLAEINQFFKDEVAGIRGSRPTPALVEDITVDCYGQKMSIKQLGSISIIPPKEVLISVWDSSVINSISKAINEKLNLNPSIDGNSLHVNLPALTQERRDEIIKLVRSRSEEARIKSRNVRDEAKKEISENEKNGELTEDDRFKLNEDMQKSIDAFNQDVEKILEKKIAEINE